MTMDTKNLKTEAENVASDKLARELEAWQIGVAFLTVKARILTTDTRHGRKDECFV